MKHNLMTKIVNDLSSGKFKKAGCYILCCLGAVIMFGTAYALFLSAGAMDSEPREAAAPESVEINDSYEVETDGLAVTVHVEGVVSHRPADEAGPDVRKLSDGNDQAARAEGERQILLASLQDPTVPQSALSAGNGTETDGLFGDESKSGSDSQKPQIECHVKKVTEGKDYEAMMAQLEDETGDADAPTQVMELTASVDGVELDLSGCQITVQATPTQELIEGVDEGGKPGLVSMTVVPLGGEAKEQLFTSGELENSDKPPVMTYTYTVKDEMPVVYAVQSRAVEHLVLDGDFTVTNWMDVYADNDMIIDLNGHSLSVERPDGDAEWYLKAPVIFVHSGGNLTIKDSVGSGEIDVSGLQAIVAATDDNTGLEEPIVHIEGGRLCNANGEHGVLVDSRGTVNIFGGTITGANASWAGGGIFAEVGSVNIFGGEIKGNAVTQKGGGIYAKKVEMTGGEISGNEVTDKYGEGGGVWAKEITMHGGKISGNTSHYIGGGVYTISMLMTDGEISGNEVCISESQPEPRGGGGIYIAENNYNNTGIGPVLTDGDIKYNMSITGGTISGNISDHTGGGIFVNIGAVVHIRGMNGKIVNIMNNKANDVGYDYDGTKNKGHGFGGGGIFVEHPNDRKGEKATDGGRVYVYNAVITQNKAQYGGGVAGCGSSSVEICSVDGVAVYGNEVHPDANDYRFKPSGDLYTDGGGTVDSKMMGDVQATWKGVDESNTPVTIEEGVKPFDMGFYLKADPLSEDDIKRIQACATVNIQGNESGSGGGGIGGNGYIKLGLKAPDSNTYNLELRKIVSGSKDSNSSEEFKFTITLKDSNGPLPGTFSYIKGVIKDSGEIGEASLTGSLTLDENGSWENFLGDKEYIVITGLPAGATYTVKEILGNGYEIPRITGTSFNTIENGYGASGLIGVNSQVTFTNTPIYELPSTGGVTPDLYYLMGCVLLTVTAGLVYRRRVRKDGCCR